MQKITLLTSLREVPLGRFYFQELAKLGARALAYPRCTRAWLRWLNSDPLYRQLAHTSPRLVSKIYHPYLNDKMACRERLAVLIAHYRFVRELGLGPLLVRAARAPVSLCTITGKHGAQYELQLSAVAPMQREGDLLLQLCHQDKPVYSVVFSFFQTGCAMAVGIGCLQGPRGDDGLDCVRDATHEWYGLRPKNLMTYLVRQLGHDCGCRHLFLVGNRNRAADYAIRKGQVHADYDALWQALGARPRANGDFVLPCEELAPPDLQLLPSKKRGEARKRHAMLVDIQYALRAALQIQPRPRLATVPAEPENRPDTPPVSQVRQAGQHAPAPIAKGLRL